MNDKNHPVWSLLRLTVLALALTLLSWINASNFDSTEAKTIVGVLIASLAAEGAPGLSGLFRRGEDWK